VRLDGTTVTLGWKKILIGCRLCTAFGRLLAVPWFIHMNLSSHVRAGKTTFGGGIQHLVDPLLDNSTLNPRADESTELYK
jgi:hypothetical protein